MNLSCPLCSYEAFTDIASLHRSLCELTTKVIRCGMCTVSSIGLQAYFEHLTCHTLELGGGVSEYLTYKGVDQKSNPDVVEDQTSGILGELALKAEDRDLIDHFYRSCKVDSPTRKFDVLTHRPRRDITKKLRIKSNSDSDREASKLANCNYTFPVLSVVNLALSQSITTANYTSRLDKFSQNFPDLNARSADKVNYSQTGTSRSSFPDGSQAGLETLTIVSLPVGQLKNERKQTCESERKNLPKAMMDGPSLQPPLTFGVQQQPPPLKQEKHETAQTRTALTLPVAPNSAFQDPEKTIRQYPTFENTQYGQVGVSEGLDTLTTFNLQASPIPPLSPNKYNDPQRCAQCLLPFSTPELMSLHLTLCHSAAETAVRCRACKLSCNTGAELQAHVEREHPDKKHACHRCGTSFKTRGSLIVHMKVIHQVSQPSALRSSQEPRSSEQEKKWECDFCHKLFTTKYFLKKHKRLHTGEAPFKCAQCDKRFTFQQSYHKHLLYHTNDKPHVCQHCGRAFREISTLHNHQRIHTGEKPFACETCGKSFRQRVSYLVHRRIHTGAMPYACATCGKSFRYKVSHKSHKCSAQVSEEPVRKSGYGILQKLSKHGETTSQPSPTTPANMTLLSPSTVNEEETGNFSFEEIINEPPNFDLLEIVMGSLGDCPNPVNFH